MNNKVWGLIGLATRAGKIVFGTDACLQGISKNKVRLILIAQDASERTKKLFLKQCKESNIKIFEFGQIDKLSKAIGKGNKAVIAIKDINFSKEIEKNLNGGEFVGENENT